MFNRTMQNKINRANQILRDMDRYPNMSVEGLLYLIECKIEGEKICYFSTSLAVQMLLELYDNRDNLGMLQCLVCDDSRA